ncbi:MAG TPA: hypothetical protein VFE62_16110 [Gemmataceae bacterium]|nr:hypothetical protein [Gemmataceae bacterium]
MVQFNSTSLLADANFGLGLLSSFGQKVDVVGIYANGSNNQSGLSSTGLSSSIINSLIGNTGATAAFGQMFVNARPLKATIRETSKVMEHPIESGAVIADHHIINPVEIELPLIVASQFYPATYTQLRQAFVDATLLSVKTRVGTYSNMIIAAMPHEEDAEMFDAITIGLHLKQVLFVVPGTVSTVQNFQPLAPANSNTIGSGLQQALAIGTQLSSAAGSLASYAALSRKGFR